MTHKDSNLVIIFWELSNIIEGLQYKIELINDEQFNAILKKTKSEIDLVLKNLNLWEQLSPKLVYGENVRTALHYLETESVQAAIVYRTDALASSLVRIELEVPSELHRDLQYHLVLLEQGNGSDAAFHFFSYLTGEESRQIFKKKGFDLSLIHI